METKLALMERLRREGRWNEADQFREETRGRLRGEGMRRAPATEEAWRLVVEKYPPQESAKPNLTAPGTEPSDQPKIVIDWETGPDFETALRRVWAALAHDPATIDVAQSPHPGCIELLKFAQADRATFFGWLAKYDAKAQKKADETTTFQDDQRKHFTLLERVREHWQARLKQQVCPTCQGSGSIPQGAKT